jgi:hypothetical protein
MQVDCFQAYIQCAQANSTGTLAQDLSQMPRPGRMYSGKRRDLTKYFTLSRSRLSSLAGTDGEGNSNGKRSCTARL